MNCLHTWKAQMHGMLLCTKNVSLGATIQETFKIFSGNILHKDRVFMFSSKKANKWIAQKCKRSQAQSKHGWTSNNEQQHHGLRAGDTECKLVWQSQGKNRQAPRRVHCRFLKWLIPKSLQNLQDENTQKLKEYEDVSYGLILLLLFSKHLLVVTVGAQIWSKIGAEFIFWLDIWRQFSSKLTQSHYKGWSKGVISQLITLQ